MSIEACSFQIELLRIALPAILVISGWVVVNTLAVNRERDKSRREMIAKTADGICEAIDKLFENANDYHSATRNSKLEVHIKIALNDLSQRIVSLSQISQETYQLTKCLALFLTVKQSITRNHFEDEHDGPVGTPYIHESIASSTLALKRSLVELKHAQFPLT